jgi:carboxyl-terminal processing protease
VIDPRRDDPPLRLLFRIFVPYFLLPGLASASALLVVFHLFVKPAETLGDDRMAWISDASNLIADRYVEAVDSDRLAWEAIAGMAQSLDPYSSFVDPENYARYREENEGRYVGIGFVIYQQGDPVTVLYPFPGSPAAKAGLETGDRVIEVDGLPTAGQSPEDVVRRIKYLPGTPVRIKLRPYGATDDARDREEVITRELIETPSVFDPRIVDEDAGIAYVRVSDFHERTADELIAALRELDAAGMRSLVLDLRRNRGGLLQQAIRVTSLFLRDEVVVRTEGRADDANVVYRTELQRVGGVPVEWHDLPLTVLVDSGSASAAEIVAGALQDHFRALLVGDRTFGKGMVQTQIPRRYGGTEPNDAISVLKITTARYLTPAGRAIEARFGFDQGEHRGGLLPDVPLRLEGEEAENFGIHLADREITAATWDLIRERCPRVDRVQGGAFVDRQLESAVSLLKGAPPFQKVT